MGNEDHSRALFQCSACCGCTKGYQLISLFWVRGIQSILGHLGHPSQLKPMFVISIELVEICCHQRTMPSDFSLLYWAKWGSVCYLDGKSASFHYYLSGDIKMKLLCSHTRLNLKSPTVWFILTLCLLILTMELAMLECKDHEIHILWFYNYLSRQQQEYLFSSSPF